MDWLYPEIPPNSILVGWSLGGTIATYFCHQFPQHCKKLIIVAGSPKFIAAPEWPGVSVKEAEKFFNQAQLDLKSLHKRFVFLVSQPYYQEYSSLLHRALHDPAVSQEYLLFYLHLLFNIDGRKLLEEITVPQLHIFGGKDAIIPINVAHLIGKFIHGEIAILPEAGHIPFISHLAQFLSIIEKE